MKLALVFAFAVCVAALPFPDAQRSSLLPSMSSDKVINLPGLPSDANISQYAGLLQLPGTSKHFFYWYIEAATSPETAPVIFWTNGGPGCSGLIGFFTEHGPFRPDANGNLTLIPTSWHTKANMVYMEQPAGVGFSFSTDSRDYTIGDAQTAKDHYAAINQFYDRYPSLLNNDIYISSESYGGHYMPNLASEFVRAANETLKFKGVFLGNPLTDMIENAKGMYDTFFGHQVVSQPIHDEWSASCSNGQSSDRCDELAGAMNQQAASLNPYALDYPVCDDARLATSISQQIWLLNHIHASNPHMRKTLKLIPPADYQPCETDYVTTYLNRRDVQNAIHVPTTNWAACSASINYNNDDVRTPMESVWKKLLADAPHLKYLIFSGDDDAVCGTLGTQSWIWKMKFKVNEDWTAWYYNDPQYSKQTGGFLVKFQGISFATVHGAGHEVPAYRPHAALTLLQAFLDGSIF